MAARRVTPAGGGAASPLICRPRSPGSFRHDLRPPRQAGRCEDTRRGHQAAAVRLKRAILEDYAHLDLRHLDWKGRFARFGARLARSVTAQDFAHHAVRLLSAAKDIHLWLQLNGETIPTYRRCVPRNAAASLLPKVFSGWRVHNPVVMSGRFLDGVFYLCVRAWPADAPAKLRPAYAVLRRAAAARAPLIIDVRANGGGAEPLAARFAGCFVSRAVCYAKHRTRRRGAFNGPTERWLRPNPTGPCYRGRVALLIGPGTVSSCESFALMMRQVPGCRLVGAATAGASGNPKPVHLGNGVTVFVPSWQSFDLDGRCLEGRGVAPDIQVKTAPADFAQGDPVLAAALRFLRGGPHRQAAL